MGNSGCDDPAPATARCVMKPGTGRVPDDLEDEADEADLGVEGEEVHDDLAGVVLDGVAEAEAVEALRGVLEQAWKGESIGRKMGQRPVGVWMRKWRR